MIRLSLVIPCYNEAKNLPLLVERCQKALAGKGLEVILVDNGSSDDSPAVLAELTKGSDLIRSVRVEVNQGYGFGILAGLEAAKGDYLAWTHADMQTDPADILKAMEMIDASPDTPLFVKGRRYGRSFADVFFTFGMSCFEWLLMGRILIDINAQPTVFPRAFFESWKNPPHDFALDLYAYYTAKRAGMKVERFPVLFGERAHGASHWNVDLKAKLKFIIRTMTYSFTLRRNLWGE